MIRNNRLHSQLDTEKAYESIINSKEFNSNTRNKISLSNDSSILSQQLSDENFDTFLEKRNRRSI